MARTISYTIDREMIADRIIENEAVILNLDNGMYYSLNEIGTRVWQLLDEGKTGHDIAAALMREYTVKPETIKKDVETIITDLLKENSCNKLSVVKKRCPPKSKEKSRKETVLARPPTA